MSLSAAVIDAMIAAGCTAEQLAAAVKADIAEQQARDARQVPWDALRQMAFARDGKVCGWCGDSEGPFEIDHVVPRAKGGENVLGNVLVSCRSCNRAKKDRDEAEWSALHRQRVDARERKRAQRERDRSQMSQAARDTPPLDGTPNEISNPPLNPPPPVVKRSRAIEPIFVLPSDIPEAEWDAFDEARRKGRNRAKWTTKAKNAAVAKLRSLADAGYPPGVVLEHCLLNGWDGIFAPKDFLNDNNAPRSRQRFEKPSGWLAPGPVGAN